MLGDVRGLSFLDAFSGSGALAIEAISRGAASAIAVEQDMDAYITIQTNLESLGIVNVEAIRKDVKSWSRNNPGKLLDVVLIDPPYDAVPYTLLHKLATHAKPGGLVVYSLPTDNDFKLKPDSHTLIVTKNYGDATLNVYRRG